MWHWCQCYQKFGGLYVLKTLGSVLWVHPPSPHLTGRLLPINSRRVWDLCEVAQLVLVIQTLQLYLVVWGVLKLWLNMGISRKFLSFHPWMRIWNSHSCDHRACFPSGTRGHYVTVSRCGNCYVSPNDKLRKFIFLHQESNSSSSWRILKDHSFPK